MSRSRHRRVGPGSGDEVAYATEPERRCPVCAQTLEGKRADAVYCGGPCRVEAWRIRRLLSGRSAGRYRCLKDRVEAIGRARHRRTQKAPGALG